MFKTQLSSWSRRGDISREDNQAVRDMVKGLRDISLVEHRNHHSTQGSHHQEDVTRHPQWLADVLAYVVWGRSAFKNSPESESKPNESKQESSPEKQTQVPGAFPNSPDEDYE